MHLKNSTGTTAKKFTGNSFWVFWSQNKKFTDPSANFFRREFLFGGYLSAWTYPKIHRELVEQGDPNASPSNQTIEKVVFGPAFETTTQEMSNLAHLLNSHQTKY